MTTLGTARMRDWLEVHDLSATDCARILGTPVCALGDPAVCTGPAAPETLAPVPPGPAELWALVAEALAVQMPVLGAVIDDAKTGTVVNFEPDPRRFPRPFTVYLQDQERVFVSCPLSGTQADILLVAHEFGHAVQLHCAPESPLPPVLRETCAFLAESWLVSGLVVVAPGFAAGALAHLQTQSAHNLGVMRHNLLACLASPEAVYDYSWNYPLARLLAQHLQARDMLDLQEALFYGRITFEEIIQYADI